MAPSTPSATQSFRAAGVGAAAANCSVSVVPAIAVVEATPHAGGIATASNQEVPALR